MPIAYKRRRQIEESTVVTIESFLNLLQRGGHNDGNTYTIKDINVNDFEGGAKDGQYFITMADGKKVYCVGVLLNQHGQELNTRGWNVAETLLRMTASEFSSASEDEQMQAVEAIDTVQLYDAVVKIVEYNGESQVRLQKLTACAVEVSDL